MTMHGVDYAGVDEDQKVGDAADPAKMPNMLKARTAGCRFAIVRAMYTAGGKAFPDHTATRDRAAWAAACGFGGFGAYMILGYGGPSPTEQARAFIAAYGPRRVGELPPSLDIEFSRGREATGLTAEQALEHIHEAFEILESYYGTVMSYTSARVWHEDLADLPSDVVSRGPLWIKTPYLYKAGQKPHPEATGEVAQLPVPWRGDDTPGAWVQQYQGDARGYPGFVSTVDCNRFLTFDVKAADHRSAWIHRRIAAFNCSDVLQFQHAFGLTPDGIIGPATFALLTT